MSPAKKQIKEISDLPYYKPEHGKVLEEMGIKTLDQLYDALNDEEKFEELIGSKKLKGVGEKHAEHWMELIEDSRVVEEAEAPAEEKPEEEEKVEVVKEPEEPRAKKVKVEEEEKKEGTEIVEPEAEVVPEKGYMAQPKPELDAATKDQLAKRAEIGSRRPAFKRQEWFRFKRLGETWRKPRGIHSKMRRERRLPWPEAGARLSPLGIPRGDGAHGARARQDRPEEGGGPRRRHRRLQEEAGHREEGRRARHQDTHQDGIDNGPEEPEKNGRRHPGMRGEQGLDRPEPHRGRLGRHHSGGHPNRHRVRDHTRAPQTGRIPRKDQV